MTIRPRNARQRRELLLCPGEPVEIRRPWAGGRSVLYAWFPGYRFVSYNAIGERATVVHVGGTLDGIETSVDIYDVRRADARVTATRGAWLRRCKFPGANGSAWFAAYKRALRVAYGEDAQP